MFLLHRELRHRRGPAAGSASLAWAAEGFGSRSGATRTRDRGQGKVDIRAPAKRGVLLKRRLIPVLLVPLIGCWGVDEGGTPRPDAISRVAESDNQIGVVGGRLSRPLAVDVRAADGSVTPRAAVRWIVVSATGGTLSDSLTVADGTGRALVDYTLGQTVGPYTVRAELVENRDRWVTLSATGAAAPVLTAVSPQAFQGGDSVTLLGTGLDAARLSIEVGGVPARIVSAAGSATTFVAPSCLAPGSVTLRARLETATSNGLQAQYVSSATPLALQVGDYVSVASDQLAGCATLPDAGPAGAEYVVAPQSVTGSPGLSAAYRLTGDSITVVTALPPAAPAGAMPVKQTFHDFLRRTEESLAGPRRRPQPAAAPAAPAYAQPLEVGDQRTFRVCSTVTCSLVPDFTEVTGEAVYVGDHAAIYLDLNAPPGGMTQEDLTELGTLFDQELYDVDTRAFGSESDIDEDGVVAILMSPVVNALTPATDCSSAIITGFFFAIDIDPGLVDDERSNQAEVFYTIVPDPTGSVRCPLTPGFVKRQVPVTFAHEFQHMISFNQHVLVRGGNVELLWLNEAMSHLGEELAAQRFRDLGDEDRFSQFVFANLSNAYRYLEAPGLFYTIPSMGTGSLEERGSAWLFLRWLVDQFGNELPRRLSETKRTGEANVAFATGEPMTRLLGQWFMANYVSDLPGFVAPQRLTYDAWALRTTYRELNSQRPQDFRRSFPLRPIVLSGGAFQPRLGTLFSGSGDYFRVVQAPGQPGFTLRMTSGSGAPLTSVVVPRLNVIRVR